MSNPVYQLLEAGQNLIRDPAHWTQGAYARNASGRKVDASGDAAACFCSMGALARAERDGNFQFQNFVDAQRLLEVAAGSGLTVVTFNDNREHYQVMALWDAAKELANAAAA